MADQKVCAECGAELADWLQGSCVTTCTPCMRKLFPPLSEEDRKEALQALDDLIVELGIKE